MNAQVKIWQLFAAIVGVIAIFGTVIFNTGVTIATTNGRVSNLESWKADFVPEYRTSYKEMNAKQDQIIKTQNEILLLIQNKQDRKK